MVMITGGHILEGCGFAAVYFLQKLFHISSGRHIKFRSQTTIDTMTHKNIQSDTSQINNGIQFLQQFKIHVLPQLEELITEFENYTWRKDKKTGEYYNEPIDDFNHLMDALRYAVEDARTPKTVKATNSI